MASVNVTAAPTFPEDALLAAYRRQIWPGPAPRPGDVPRLASPSAEARVEALGYALLEGLADDTEYYVGGVVATVWHWLMIRTPKAPVGTGTAGAPGVGVPAGGSTGQVATKKSGADFDVQWSNAAGGVSSGELASAVAAEATLRTNADAGKAPLADPHLTGTPTVPTAAPGTNTTQAASTAFTTAAVAAEALLRAAADVQLRKVVALGIAVTGNLTPNLEEGRIFKGTMTGATAVQTPTHTPADGTTSYIELELTGESAITFPGIADWKYGVEPPQSPGFNRYSFFSDDNGATWYGVGSEGLPSDVVRAGGTPTDKQVPTWNAGEERPLWVTPAAAGLSESAVNARIEALAMLLSEKPGFALRPTAHLLTAASGPIARDTFNRITKNGSTWAMAAFAGSPHDGELTIVENGATAAVSFEVGALGGGTQTFTMEPGEIIVLIGDVTAAAAESLAPRDRLLLRYKPNGLHGAFTGLTLVAAKVEQTASSYAHGARMEADTSVLRLRGVLTVKAGKPIAAGEKFATLPAAVTAPTSTVMKTARNAATGASIPFTINTSGELAPVAEVSAAVQISFDDTPTIGI